MLTYDLTARGRKTMYEYLYEAMKADILSGRLTAGEKLPSKRAFAEHLQVSVKTVENTYEQLLLEGYIRSEEKRGYFVNRLEVKSSHSGVCFLCDPFQGGGISGGSDGK